MKIHEDEEDFGFGSFSDYESSRAPERNEHLDRHFMMLEAQLARAIEISERIVGKHWHIAEKEQYPFWIGIIVISILGIIGMYTRDIAFFALTIAVLMLIALAFLVWIYLVNVQGRFSRQWERFVSDGELFKYLKDVGNELGFRIELGKPDENLTVHLNRSFPVVVRAVEDYLRSLALPDPLPYDHPTGYYFPPRILIAPPGGDAHRVYEIEYRGIISRVFSIRIAATEQGTILTVGFSFRTSNAETKDKLIQSLRERIQDKMIAAKVVSDLLDKMELPKSEA